MPTVSTSPKSHVKELVEMINFVGHIMCTIIIILVKLTGFGLDITIEGGIASIMH